MKKNLFLVAIAAVAMTSCSNEIDNVVPADSSLKAIEFRPLVTRNGAETTAASIAGFKTFAYLGTQATPQNDDTKYLETTVTNSSGTWTPAAASYWPDAATNKLHFYAISPASLSYTVSAIAPATALSVTTVDGDTDILMAASPNLTSTDNDGRVAFTFKHALAQIKISAKNLPAEAYYVIKSIAVTGLKKEGRVAFDGADFAWMTDGAAADYTYACTLAEGKLTAGSTEFVPLNTTGGLFVIPQEVTGAKIVITYDINAVSGDGKIGGGTATIPLVAMTAGKSYTYQLTLNDQGAQVAYAAPAVTGIDDAEPTDANVPEEEE